MARRETAGAPLLPDLVPIAFPEGKSPLASYLRRMDTVASRATVRASLEALASLASGAKIPAPAIPWHHLRYTDTSRLRRALAERYAPASGNLRLAVLRGILKECWRLRLMSGEDFRRAADLGAIRGSTLPRGRAVTPDELAAVAGACRADPTALGRRDAAVLGLLYGCGLRRSEVSALTLAMWTPLREELRVPGKGRRARIVPATGAVAERLVDWVEVRGRRAGALLHPIGRNLQLLRDRHLSPEALLWICRRRARAAGIDRFSPHDLRRTFASDLLERGIDLALVQRLLGHAKVETTVRYDRRGDAATQAAARVLDVPF